MGMQKKLYFTFRDGHDVNLVMELSGIMTYIEVDSAELSQEDMADKLYTLTPIYLTEEEYDNLPEGD